MGLVRGLDAAIIARSIAEIHPNRVDKCNLKHGMIDSFPRRPEYCIERSALAREAPHHRRPQAP